MTLQSQTLREFDDRFTSKMFGFKDWREYYTGYLVFIQLSVRGSHLLQFSQVMLQLYFSLNLSVMFQFYVSVMFLCFSYAPVCLSVTRELIILQMVIVIRSCPMLRSLC